ncbi:hypothetical protein [Pseudonocardia yunnanensis]|uniref:Transcriptional regulator, AbiEi antitoxin, Type IV TA system n=1 Tax=Pseudonocardia yunnanensis TaxID=58107 RepID=A0ABW4EP87_9PSEU
MPRRSNLLRTDEFATLCGATVVRVDDLVRLGLARSTIAHRCRAGGPWRRMVPGVVKLDNGPPTRADRRRAALLHAGHRAVLTGLDALELHGMERMPQPSGPVHVLVPTERRRSGSGLVLVERTERLPSAVPGRWPLAPIPRAALDAVRRIGDRDQVRGTLAEVVQRGRCTPADLGAELDLGSGRGSALPRTVLAEIGDGVRSAAEAEARALVLRSGLPAPLWNPALYDHTGRFIAMPDAWFDDVGMAWEIDSTEWHLSPADYERTLDRHAAMTAANVVVLHTQPSKLVHRSRDAVDELRRTYHNAACRPRPPLIAIPAPGLGRPARPSLSDDKATRTKALDSAWTTGTPVQT